jgi:hypothetical protein
LAKHKSCQTNSRPWPLSACRKGVAEGRGEVTPRHSRGSWLPLSAPSERGPGGEARRTHPARRSVHHSHSHSAASPSPRSRRGERG